jgi:Sec20
MKTQHLLKNELHRVSHITHAIDEDETMLRQTMDHHQSLNTKQAQKALTALQRAQQQEQRVLTASIVFFILTVLYIMWSRVMIKFDVVSVILDWMV